MTATRSPEPRPATMFNHHEATERSSHATQRSGHCEHIAIPYWSHESSYIGPNPSKVWTWML